MALLKQNQNKSKFRKLCPVCKEVKTLTEFHIKSAAYDGHASNCILCANQIRRNEYIYLRPNKMSILKQLEQRIEALEAKVNENNT